MNTPKKSHLPSALQFITAFFATCLSLVPRAFAEPICANPTLAPKVAVTGLEAIGNDLEAELSASPGVGPITLDLWLNESTILASTTVPAPSAGTVNVTIPGVLAGAEARDIRYYLEATDGAGNPMMAPYPFLLFFDCQGSCSYRLVPGVMTQALVVSEKLSHKLKTMPPCQTWANLQLLKSDPEFRMAAQTLIGQLEERDLDNLPPGCHHEWQAVLRLDSWIPKVTHLLSPDRRHTVAQLDGRQSGAAGCYLLQGTSLQDQPQGWSFPEASQGQIHTSQTWIEQSILCLQTTPFCGPCLGDVDVYFDYDRCLTAEAMVCNGESEANASAMHAMSFQVKNDLIFDRHMIKAEARACLETGCDGGWPIYMPSEAKDDLHQRVKAPAQVTLTSETRLSYSSSGRRRDGATFSLAESNFEYRLRLIGSGASCTASDLAESWAVQPTTTQDDGGIKMRRWWPDDGFRVAFPSPETPGFCQRPASGDPTR